MTLAPVTPAVTVTATTTVTTTMSTTVSTAVTTADTAAASAAAVDAVHNNNDKSPRPHNQVELSHLLTYLFSLGICTAYSLCLYQEMKHKKLDYCIMIIVFFGIY